MHLVSGDVTTKPACRASGHRSSRLFARSWHCCSPSSVRRASRFAISRYELFTLWVPSAWRIKWTIFVDLYSFKAVEGVSIGYKSTRGTGKGWVGISGAVGRSTIIVLRSPPPNRKRLLWSMILALFTQWWERTRNVGTVWAYIYANVPRNKGNPKIVSCICRYVKQKTAIEVHCHSHQPSTCSSNFHIILTTVLTRSTKPWLYGCTVDKMFLKLSYVNTLPLSVLNGWS